MSGMSLVSAMPPQYFTTRTRFEPRNLVLILKCCEEIAETDEMPEITNLYMNTATNHTSCVLLLGLNNSTYLIWRWAMVGTWV